MTSMKTAYRSPANQWRASALPNLNRRDARSGPKNGVGLPTPPSPLAGPTAQLVGDARSLESPVKGVPGVVRRDTPRINFREAAVQKKIRSEFNGTFSGVAIDHGTLKTSRTPDGNYKFAFTASRLSQIAQVGAQTDAKVSPQGYYSGVFDTKSRTVKFNEPNRLVLPEAKPESDLKVAIERFWAAMQQLPAKLKALFGIDAK